MSKETMTLEERFCRLERRFEAMEGRCAVLEEHIERVLSLVVRITEGTAGVMLLVKRG